LSLAIGNFRNLPGNRKKQIPVIGVAEFLGSNLTGLLIFARHKVTDINNLSVGDRANIADHLNYSSFQFSQTAVTDELVLEQVKVIRLVNEVIEGYGRDFAHKQCECSRRFTTASRHP
jgi:UDP-glucose 4-epimerase